MIVGKDRSAHWLPTVGIDQWRVMSTALGYLKSKKSPARASGFLFDRRDAITPACRETPTKEPLTMVPILQKFSKSKKATPHIIRRVAPCESWGSAPALEVSAHDA
jgi:hypothetical protein